MIAALGFLLAAAFAAQLAVVGGAAWGPLAPDPTPLLVALAGRTLPAGRRPLAALAIGLGRGLVLLEPAGGHVLAAWLGGELVALLVGRGGRGAARWLIAGGLGAGAFLLVARGLATFGASASAGLPLLGGVLLVPLLAGFAALAGGSRRRRRA